MKSFISNTPLTRDQVTSASRIMLPTYVGLFLGLGLNYITIPHNRRADSPAVAFADGFLWVALWGWGLMFFCCGMFLLIALLTHLRDLYRLALTTGMICMGIWAIVFLGSSLYGGASPAAAIWPLFAAIACKATVETKFL